MGLSFLVPFFFAGLTLLIAPYLIHQIRRPEREPLRFSSLLFIPDAPREVIERRRVQHILLMLLRMLLLALLAVAFSRPYWKMLALGEDEAGASRHLILVDTSYSMGAKGVLTEAKKKAERIVSDLGPDDRVGVVSFAGSPRLIAPIEFESDAEAGSKARALEAIRSLEVTEEDTAYVPALRMAQRLLHAVADDEEETMEADRPISYVHVVSDFQRTGMPTRQRGWKLPSSIELHPVHVSQEKTRNLAVSDVGFKTLPNGSMRVLGKIKNWSRNDDQKVSVKLVLNGSESGTETVSVKAGNATQVSFLLKPSEIDLSRVVEGVIEIGDDDLPADNRRHFVWQPQRKQAIFLVAEVSGESAEGGREGAPRWTTDWFLKQAFISEADVPWTVEVVEGRDLPARMGEAPVSAVILSDLNGLNEEELVELLAYVRQGGRLFAMFKDVAEDASSGASMFAELGLRTTRLRYPKVRETRFDMLSWVDLDHEIFVPFRGTRFNDFSSLRFYNYVLVTVDETVPTTRVVARFEGDAPAMIEADFGEGRMVLWPYPLWLEWTNLPKSSRFVPLVHETLKYLSGIREETVARQVGDVTPSASLNSGLSGAWTVQFPGEEKAVDYGVDSSPDLMPAFLRRSGFLRAKAAGRTEWDLVSAVNLDAREGDTLAIPIDEFEIKLASAPVLFGEGSSAGVLGGTSGVDQIVEEEYGRRFLFLLFAFLIAESWYMSRLRG